MSSASYPAVKHYWFGKAYRDMWAVIKDSHSRNMLSASRYWLRARTGSSLVKVFFAGAAAMVVIAGTLMWLILVPLHVGVVAIIASCVAMAFVTMDAAERCFLWYKGWSTVCRHCGEKVGLPEFQCPHCRAWHTRLRPSSFGILTHRCRCGQKLPCTFLSKRYDLVARCPHEYCAKPLNAELETRSTSTVIGFVGPPSSGKTALMIAAMETLLRGIAPANGFRGRFTDRGSEEFFEDEKRHILAAGTTRKTVEAKPPAFDAVFDSSDGSLRHQVLLFDAAGDIFVVGMDGLDKQYHLKHINGGIIVIDPFSLPVLKAKYGAALRKQGLDRSIALDDPIDIIDRFLNAMQRHFGLSHDRLVRRPYAIVVTKADLGALNKNLVPDIPADTDGFEKRQLTSDHLRTKLQEWGGESLVNQIEGRFANVMYFPVAPIRIRKRDSGFEATLACWGVRTAVEWILESAKDPLVNGR